MKPAFVVLTDLSGAADAALTYTTRLAACLDGRLVLLHVFLNVSALIEPETVLATTTTQLAARRQLRANLCQQAEKLPLTADAELSLDTLDAAVRGAVQRHQPLLLALGREQPHSLLGRLIPHRTVSILRSVRHPLLVVPEGCPETELPRRVLVAADGQSFWLTPPSLALGSLLLALRPTTSVVHVATQTHGPSRGNVALESVRRTRLFGPLTSRSLHEVRDASPADGILLMASELQAQLLVLLARPHSFLGGLFHRSVTAQVLRHSPVPVLVLPTN
ncbi:universal stress protein [Hymenobacter caeli]|uniref:Nucleotide-binding universal stress UspA family protein n=1 Tax=Hymenobacter caeli TaxID=2735894 RepID=A0ABX2FT05_9BACT|nr:universal stress protein [Hymenobacter caeli]NRT19611.1 nucleotide-binding universal stress UspA family protein [Hymenobacter caeli]